VIGAINVDLVVMCERLPRPGETVTGGTFAQHHGGKGGNQAVAAARALGARGRAAIVGAVGDDALGTAAIDALLADGVEPAVLRTPDERTGVAVIVVDARGENQIAVAPGANARVEPRRVRESLAELRPRLVLASLEVPPDAVRAAGAWCAAAGAPLMLNPAPASAAAAGLAGLATYLTPNETEIGALGGPPEGVVVVETRGPGGARIHRDGAVEEVPAPVVDARDTTGAGDCFNGVLAAGLLEGLDLGEAVRRAVVAAALSVTRPGAREGMPTRAEIEAALARWPSPPP
jgi:ribokinase